MRGGPFAKIRITDLLEGNAMKDNFNLEDALKRCRIDPGPRVKRSVLERFARVYGRRAAPAGPFRMWRRPVPAYLATAVVVVAVFMSFFAGRTSQPQRSSMTGQMFVEERDTLALYELEWETARRDLF
jgi:hypothetical protein